MFFILKLGHGILRSNLGTLRAVALSKPQNNDQREQEMETALVVAAAFAANTLQGVESFHF